MRYKYTDYHVHTRWSSDIPKNGPNFEDYLLIAESNHINVCFLEHYELYYVKNDKNHPFYDGKIDIYLEEIDKIKETYNFALSGLEIDYYIGMEKDILEFLDDYGECIDFIAGSIHECDIKYPITERNYIIDLLKKKPIKEIIDDYFNSTKEMINSKIFKNICHIDTIFRYININDIKPTDNCDISDKRILDIGLLCINNNISIEYNLSGLRYSLNRPFPSKEIITNLKKKGGNIFVGSDSHDLNYFQDSILKIKEAYQYLNNIK